MQALPLNRSAAELPVPSDDARRHSDRLVEEIRLEVERHRGWISFTRYMDMALYAPGLGYYVAGAAKLGAEGDFVTAPEISPLFGRTLARQVADILAHTGGGVLELGAGSGTLALSLLEELQTRNRLPDWYRILEVSPELVRRQRRLLLQRLPGVAGRVEWVTSLPPHFTGVVVANEVLDALPVHLLAWREEGVLERGVSWKGGGFAWAERSLAPGALRAVAAGLQIEAPYQSEVSIAAPALLRTLAGALHRGVLLCMDYGFGRREYYHPQRNRGTLMCHYRHRAHDNPFFFPGLQDITAHVDFTSVAEAGVEAGMQLLGYTTQARFLINCGIADLLARTPAEQPAAYLPLAAGVQKLISPAEMGELFKVIALGRDVQPPLAGFNIGDKSRLL